MDLSGMIFVVLALAWAVYLIPKALKHHDEVARTRSIDRFSTALRVLARREPVSRSDARLVITPPRPSHHRSGDLRLGHPQIVLPVSDRSAPTPQAVGSVPPAEVSSAQVARASTSRRAAARAAARRRRHLLLFLLLVVAVVAVAAAFRFAPWWSVAIPAGLTVAYLLLCRAQVRRSRRLAVPRDVAQRESSLPKSPEEREMEQVGSDDDTVVFSRAALATAMSEPSSADAAAVAVHAAQTLPAATTVPSDPAVPAVAAVAVEQDRGSLWDPLPMTLPTYVDKRRAPRTVRTIDLSQPGTWSSGRSQADSTLVEKSEAARREAAAADATAKTAAEAALGDTAQRAVGS